MSQVIIGLLESKMLIKKMLQGMICVRVASTEEKKPRVLLKRTAVVKTYTPRVFLIFNELSLKRTLRWSFCKVLAYAVPLATPCK
jgi:hypothetical protein